MLIGMHSAEAPSSIWQAVAVGDAAVPNVTVVNPKSGGSCYEYTGWRNADNEVCCNAHNMGAHTIFDASIAVGFWMRRTGVFDGYQAASYFKGNGQIRWRLYANGSLQLLTRSASGYALHTLINQLNDSWHHLAWSLSITNTTVDISVYVDMSKIQTIRLPNSASWFNRSLSASIGTNHVWPNVAPGAKIYYDNYRIGTTVADIMPRAPRITRF